MNPLDAGALALLFLGVFFGVRSGALPQIGGLIGAAAGAYLGLLAIPIVLPNLDSASVVLRVIAVIGLLLVAVGLGEMIGARGGRAVSGLLGPGLLGALDRVAGGIVGAGQAVLIVWLVGGILATGLLPSAERQAQTSVALRGLAAVLPPPTELVLELGRVFDSSGLPDVFLGLERLPADPVGLPTDAIVAALGQAALASVPRVEALACDYKSTGTGVVIRTSYVVTNAHVVAGSRKIQIVTTSGAFDAIPVFLDPNLDVALLYVPGLRAVPLSFSNVVPDRGSLGATIGYPDGGRVVIEPAAVTATYIAEGLDITGAHKVARQIVELRALVQPGDSGGPLLLSDGTVGGLVFAESKADPAVGYALTPTAVAVDVTPALGRTVAVPTGACLH